MGDKKPPSQPNWFSTNFNSTTLRGRANVAKATYGFFALSYIFYKLTRKKGGDDKSKKESNGDKMGQHNGEPNYERQNGHHNTDEYESNKNKNENDHDHNNHEPKHQHYQHPPPLKHSSCYSSYSVDTTEEVNLDDNQDTKKVHQLSINERDIICAP